jgi:hypothetical protein
MFQNDGFPGGREDVRVAPDIAAHASNAAALADAQAAIFEYENAQDWFRSVVGTWAEPLAGAGQEEAHDDL